MINKNTSSDTINKMHSISIQDIEGSPAMFRLMRELDDGRISGETEGYVTADEARKHFRSESVCNEI